MSRPWSSGLRACLLSLSRRLLCLILCLSSGALRCASPRCCLTSSLLFSPSASTASAAHEGLYLVRESVSVHDLPGIVTQLDVVSGVCQLGLGDRAITTSHDNSIDKTKPVHHKSHHVGVAFVQPFDMVAVQNNPCGQCPIRRACGWPASSLCANNRFHLLLPTLARCLLENSRAAAGTTTPRPSRSSRSTFRRQLGSGGTASNNNAVRHPVDTHKGIPEYVVPNSTIQ